MTIHSLILKYWFSMYKQFRKLLRVHWCFSILVLFASNIVPSDCNMLGSKIQIQPKHHSNDIYSNKNEYSHNSNESHPIKVQPVLLEDAIRPDRQPISSSRSNIMSSAAQLNNLPQMPLADSPLHGKTPFFDTKILSSAAVSCLDCILVNEKKTESHHSSKTLQSKSEHEDEDTFLSDDDSVRLESIKRQILSKLGLISKPNISSSIPREVVLQTLGRANVIKGSVEIGERQHDIIYQSPPEELLSPEVEIDDFYGHTSEIITFAEPECRIKMQKHGAVDCKLKWGKLLDECSLGVGGMKGRKRGSNPHGVGRVNESGRLTGATDIDRVCNGPACLLPANVWFGAAQPNLSSEFGRNNSLEIQTNLCGQH
uniref:Uncharacterized protein n=1 Tax=Timema monikensis TaxID=170555 RepID=A0A7R9EB81_9NEOP|nr:unnamed protein product [Timema monikensis]